MWRLYEEREELSVIRILQNLPAGLNVNLSGRAGVGTLAGR
jgi:hypothetical protein